jgi:hypothetical protein
MEAEQLTADLGGNRASATQWKFVGQFVRPATKFQATSAARLCRAAEAVIMKESGTQACTSPAHSKQVPDVKSPRNGTDMR